MIMIVEDEFLVALDIEGIVLDCGLSLHGSYATVKEAIDASKSTLPSCAILDVRLVTVSKVRKQPIFVSHSLLI